jgi:sphingolipid delta-4 desaturase
MSKEPTMTSAFDFSTPAQPHPERTKAILRQHPDVRDLMGRNPWTAAILIAVVLLQAGLAALMGHLGTTYWWLALIAAYLVGAFANNCLYVIIHEATHNLIFRDRRLNKLAAIAADLPNILPAAIGFSICHLEHHAYQGDYDRDADLASHWEADLVGNRWYAKAIWLILFPVLQVARPARFSSISVMNRWTILSVVAAVTFDIAIVLFCGWNGLLYLAASVLFALGLHPLGARWIQEHYTLDPKQETFSYYGPLNFLTLNVGYHNEHHDFPSIPWNRLPALRAKAPEFYDTLESKQSLSRLLAQFIFDPRYSLHSRVVRDRMQTQPTSAA